MFNLFLSCPPVYHLPGTWTKCEQPLIPHGNLQGLNKAETASRYGNDQLLKWRRSFKTKPPKLNDKDYQLQFDNPLFKDIPKESISRGESLEDTVIRVKQFYNQIIIPSLDSQNNILIE